MTHYVLFIVTAGAILLSAPACGGLRSRSQTTPMANHSPLSSPVPLPISGYSVAWLDHKVPDTMESGKEYELIVTIRNTGNVNWPSKGTDGGVVNRVSISYHWLAANEEKIVGFEGHRTLLPHDIAPGESITMEKVVVTTPDTGFYRLQLTLVHEGVTWFEQQGAKTLIVPITVN
jgi:hypothetical protein